MAPAGQGLETGQASITEADHRLVERLDLSPDEGPSQIILEGQARQAVLALWDVIPRHAGPCGDLGQSQSSLGTTQDVLRSRTVEGVRNGGPGLEAGVQGQLVQLHRALHGLAHALRRVRVIPRHHHGKGVVADPRRKRALAEGIRQPLGEGGQDLVGQGISQGLVHPPDPRHVADHHP